MLIKPPVKFLDVNKASFDGRDRAGSGRAGSRWAGVKGSCEVRQGPQPAEAAQVGSPSPAEGPGGEDMPHATRATLWDQEQLPWVYQGRLGGCGVESRREGGKSRWGRRGAGGWGGQWQGQRWPAWAVGVIPGGAWVLGERLQGGE